MGAGHPGSRPGNSDTGSRAECDVGTRSCNQTELDSCKIFMGTVISSSSLFPSLHKINQTRPRNVDNEVSTAMGQNGNYQQSLTELCLRPRCLEMTLPFLGFCPVPRGSAVPTHIHVGGRGGSYRQATWSVRSEILSSGGSNWR